MIWPMDRNLTGITTPRQTGPDIHQPPRLKPYHQIKFNVTPRTPFFFRAYYPYEKSGSQIIVGIT